MTADAQTGGRLGLLGRPNVYRLWQWPFAAKKLAPFYRHNDVSTLRHVLDVACGPGTNARHFAHASYVGVDINENYLRFARRRHRGRFVAADLTRWHPPERWFDCVLINSFLHHVDDEAARRILSAAHDALLPDGHVHVLDLVLPERPNAARFLARQDRGSFPRSLDANRRLFEERFEPAEIESFDVGLGGICLWEMVYFKGRPRVAAR